MNSRSSAMRANLIAVTVLVVTVYGCGTSESPTAHRTDLPEQVTIDREITLGTGPFVLEDPKIGLSDLKSYTATLTISFEGTQDGSAHRWSKTYVMVADQEHQSRELSLEKTGDLSSLEPRYTAERAGASYEWQGGSSCFGNPIEADNSLSKRLEPAGMLGIVIGAEEAGSETTNGVPSNHYTFDQQALGLGDLTESTGELWAASDGGYIVKYLLASKGKADYFGEGTEGTLTLDYELTGVNEPVEIEIPADCPPGLVDAPQMADASDLVSAPGLLTYTTASTIQDAAAFYQQELPKLGWQSAGESSVTEESALMTFDRDAETMVVSMTLQNGTTNVQIAVLPTQK
jgi:hypothetical protein